MILGVDYGRKRIGLAILHGDGLVLPLTTIQQVSRKDSLVRIGRYVAEFECRQVIVGLPANADARQTGIRDFIGKNLITRAPGYKVLFARIRLTGNG